jgi:hypothetical protein
MVFDSMYNNYVNVVKKNLNLDPKDLFFKSSKNYREVLEHVSFNFGKEYLELIKKDFPTIYTENKSYFIQLSKTNDKYGKTFKNKFVDFCECSPSNLRYLYQSLIILDYIKSSLCKDEYDFVEIGGGYGGLCFFIHNLVKIFDIKVNSYTIFDIEDVQKLQKKYLKLHNIDINTYNLDTNFKLNNNSFLISNYAFSEISKGLQKKYRNQVLDKYIEHGFIAWNYIPVYDFIANKDIIVKEEKPLTGDPKFNRFVYF